MRVRPTSSVFSLNRPVLALLPLGLVLLIGVLATLALVIVLPASIALPVFAIQAAMLFAGLALIGLTARRFHSDARLDEQAIRAVFHNYQHRLQQLLDRCESDGRLITALQASRRADRTLSEKQVAALTAEMERIDSALSVLSDGRLKVRLKAESPLAGNFNALSAQLRDMDDLLTKIEMRLSNERSQNLFERTRRLSELLDDVQKTSDRTVTVLAEHAPAESDDGLGAALAEDAATLSLALEEVSDAMPLSSPEPETPAPARTPELDHLSSERRAAG